MPQSFLRLLLAFTAIIALAQDKPDSLAIVVGKTSSMDEVTFADLQRIFKAEKAKTPDGKKILLLMNAAGLERETALREIYKMTEAEYSRFFLQATFTGSVQAAPKALASSAAIKQFVAENPGAIGYVRSHDLDDSVKALKVDGKAPGDADYKLKLAAK